MSLIHYSSSEGHPSLEGEEKNVHMHKLMQSKLNTSRNSSMCALIGTHCILTLV